MKTAENAETNESKCVKKHPAAVKWQGVFVSYLKY